MVRRKGSTMSIVNQPQFQDEAAAYEWLEARVWPNGPVCPHCGNAGRFYVSS